MAIHFYDESPSPPDEQLARLEPPIALQKAGIPCVVWAEDALSIVHRVPTCLFDQQLLVPDDCLEAAAHTICSMLPYTRLLDDDRSARRDVRLYNPERPHVYDLNNTSLLLRHQDPDWAVKNMVPSNIFIHSASVFHLDIKDPSNTCLNPAPPSDESRRILFPSLAAFFDSLIGLLHEPPHAWRNLQLTTQLNTYISYLSLYTLSDNGMTYNKVEGSSERTLIPSCITVLREVKDENQPFLIRHFLMTQCQQFLDSATERLILRGERYARMGIPHNPKPIPYDPYLRSRGRPYPSEPRLTPFMNKETGFVEWRALAKYASIAHRMLR